MADRLKVSILDLTNAGQALAWLGEQKLPLDHVLAFIATRRVANQHVKDFYEARNSIIKRYAGDAPTISQERLPEANAEIEAVLRGIVEVPDPGLTWEATKGLFTTANQLEPLLWLIHDVPLG
jgi:hypothetical protein